MKIARRNIFFLPDPPLYDCFIERYQSNFLTLRIRVERFPNKPLPERNIMELVFTSVLFYEGATNWTGCDVCIASQNDLLEWLYRSGIFTSQTDEEEIEEALETYHLFVILTQTSFHVKFIGSSEDYTMNVIR